MAREILTAIIRQMVSAALGTWIAVLVKSGIPESQVLMFVAVVVAFAVNILWAIGERLLKRWNLLAALNMAPGATQDDLKAIVSQVPMTTRISQIIQVPTQQVQEVVRAEIEKTPIPKGD